MSGYFHGAAGPFVVTDLLSLDTFTRDTAFASALLTDAEARITLAGQLEPVTANVSADAIVDAAVAGQLSSLTATFTAEALVDATLAGQITPVTGDVAVEAVPDVADITLDGQIGPLAADITLDAPAQATLAGQVGPLTAAFVAVAEDPPVPAYLLVLDPVIEQPPASIRVVMANLEPLTEVTFEIDDIVVGTEISDANGDILEIVLPVDRQFTAGEHTLTGTTTGHTASGTFEVLRSAYALPTTPAPDADPELVEDAIGDNGVYRWVFQDLMPGGIGSWVMPINPTTMSNPHVRKTLAPASTTAVNGRSHVGEGATPIEWEFAGFAPDQAFQDKLTAYFELPYRFYIVDHRNRAWTVAITSLDVRPRKRIIDSQGQPRDDLADYTVKVALFSQQPAVPVPA